MALAYKPNRAPYQDSDSTRNWIESYRVGGLVKPNFVLRFATDNCYVRNQNVRLPAYNNTRQWTRSLMNTTLPCMRVPNLVNWSVSESLESEVTTASFEMLNCLLVSETETTLTSNLTDEEHSPEIKTNYASNSYGVTDKINATPGNNGGNLTLSFDQWGVRYREFNLKFRQFKTQTFTVAEPGRLPNPGIPRDDDDNDCPDDSFFEKDVNGAGSYYVMIDDEVIRLCEKNGSTFHIPPGGRGIGTTPVQAHTAGAKVKLLGFAPFTGEAVAHGLYTVNEDEPQKSPFRAGVCLTSYEGYGKFNAPLKHQFKESRNYTFTGYWFVKNTEDSYGEDGVPRMRVELEGPGSILANQLISADIVQRIKNKFGQWEVQGEDVFSAAGHKRNIPGDWVDFNSWDSALKDSYPLKIKTEYAQHKEYYDHMMSTELGAKCSQCREELAAFIKKRGESPDNVNAQNRAVGRHIYKQSIRVMNDTPSGPIKTYIRLIHTLAMAAWDHPPQGVELAQRFTKIPNRLFDNMRNIYAGTIYSGQLDFKLAPSKEHDAWAWDNISYDDEDIVSKKKEFSAPFESTYDKTPFSQPARDLADANDCVYWINRRGYPVFMPRNFRMRPSGFGKRDLEGAAEYSDSNDGKVDKKPGQWKLFLGGSVQSYTKTIDSSSIITQCWVTATTAFQSTFTIASAGTGYTNSGKRVLYGGASGHKEGLGLTGGVQRVDTASMDSQILGLDWNSNPATWGMKIEDQDGTTVVEKKPQLYDGSPALNVDDKKADGKRVKLVQKTVNWFLERRLINPVQDPKDDKKYWYLIDEDGEYGPITGKAVSAVRVKVGAGADKTYNRQAYTKIKEYIDNNKEWLQHDIFWYVYNGRTWEEYVAHITGIPIPVKSSDKKSKTGKGTGITDSKGLETPKWIIDDKGLQKEVEKWQKQFIQQAVNVGNRRVDQSFYTSVSRQISVKDADPRIQPGDVIMTDAAGDRELKGVYVVSVSRTLDMTNGSYTGSYTGYKYVPLHGKGAAVPVNPKDDFLNDRRS